MSDRFKAASQQHDPNMPSGPLQPDRMLGVLTSILDEISGFVYVSDMETDELLFMNKMMRDTFGHPHGAAGQKCWQVMQSGMSGRCPFCPVPKLIEDPDTPVYWEENNTVTGRCYSDVDSVIEWTDGRKVHMQYAVDITEIKDMQQEAEKARVSLQSIFNGMDAFVYVSDMETDEIYFINNHMREAFGLANDAVGKVCWQVLQDGFTQRCSFCPNYKLQADPDTSITWEEHNTVTGRHYKNVDSVIEWTDGKKVHLQHSTDITDIMQAREDSQRARKRLELALTASNAGVWELDFERGQITYDDLCGKLFHFNAHTNIMTLHQLIEHLELVMVQDGENDVVANLRDPDLYDDSFTRIFHLAFPGGRVRHVRNYGSALRGEQGCVTRVVGMSIDITPNVTMENDLKAAKDAAEHASAAKSQFLSNMSHEIRTPMNAILGMTDLLLGESMDERQRRYVQDINVSATSLLAIINDILDFSKIEAGKLQLNPVDYDPTVLLNNLESMFSVSANAKGIGFVMDIQTPLPDCLFGDDIRLRQILINILSNAVKFTRAGGVRLTVHTEGDVLCFEVKDTGIGIREEDLPRIFGDFTQLDMSNNRNITGTGLGLSITHNLVQMMDGSIEVRSSYGEGSLFLVRIPFARGDAANLHADTETFEFVSAPDAQILVVDDNEVNLHVASGLLGLCNILCDTAQSGREAIEKVSANQYDIIFMDHMMPEMDGPETTKRLRLLPGGQELVVIALTANAVDGAREALMEMGMNDYLSKPIDKERLNRMLVKWLPADRLQRAQAPPLAPTIPLPCGEETAQPTVQLAQRLAHVPQLQAQEAIDRLGGVEQVYEKTLRLFASRLPDTVTRLQTFLANSDLPGFAIEVHGVKGSAGNVGAAALAHQAAALESAAKNGNHAFCQQNLSALEAGLLALYDDLHTALDDEPAPPAAAPAGDKDMLHAQLQNVHEMLNAFETDVALTILDELDGYDFGPEDNGRLRDIRRYIELFDYDKATELI